MKIKMATHVLCTQSSYYLKHILFNDSNICNMRSIIIFWYFSLLGFIFITCRFKLVCSVIKLQCLYSPQATREALDTYGIVKEYHLEIGYENWVYYCKLSILLSILMFATAVKYCGLKVFCFSFLRVQEFI